MAGFSTSTKPIFLDRLGEAMIRPWPGVPLALVVVLISLGIVVFGGDLIREGLLMALVEQVIVPFFERLITPMNLPTVLHNILIGEYVVFRISFEWILALVIPYVILFQAVFALLEDRHFAPISSSLTTSCATASRAEFDPYLWFIAPCRPLLAPGR